jgi:hypothetical protein
MLLHAVAAIAVATLVLTACGHGERATTPSSTAVTPEAASAPVYPSPTTPPDTEPSRPDPADYPGRVTVTYEDANSPDTQRGKSLMQDAQFLEGLADSINQSLLLPNDITLKGADCGEENAFWSSADQTITMCYEFANWALNTFTSMGDEDPAQSALGLLTATFYHESGHMLTSIYDLPTTGREEDVADQAAAFILLQPGEDGRIDPDALADIMDYARGFQQDSEDRGPDVPDWLLADPHTLDKARMYNFECWVYGADPTGNADLVGDGMLSQDRADGCPGEFDKLTRAWGRLLDPYLR